MGFFENPESPQNMKMVAVLCTMPYAPCGFHCDLRVEKAIVKNPIIPVHGVINLR
jgi:hypothetical protein